MFSLRKVILGEKFSLYRYLGVLVSATSAFSLLQRLFDFGLAPMFLTFVAFYRTLSNVAFGWISFIFSFEFPPTVHDLWTLSCLGAGVYFRSTALGEPASYAGVNKSMNSDATEADANSQEKSDARGIDLLKVASVALTGLSIFVMFSGILLFLFVLAQAFRFDRILGEPPMHPGPRRKWEPTLEWTAEVDHYYSHKQTRLVARIFWETIAVLLLFFALNAFSVSLPT